MILDALDALVRHSIAALRWRRGALLYARFRMWSAAR
jgi:hypothetical protein